MRKIFVFIFGFAIVSLIACEELNQIVEEQQQENTLTNEEIVEGLKSALLVSTDTSVSIVSTVNGYYKDEVIKILLPPEANVIYEHKDDAIFTALGLNTVIDTLLEDVVLKINRAAENAAVKSIPIFTDAVTNIDITDGMNILTGEDTAATYYLKINTTSQLKTAFRPDINDALNADIVLGVSANETWEQLISTYNSVANTLAGQLAGLEPVNTDLGDFVTSKALNGLFNKIAIEEKEIRHNIADRINDILKKVFGWLDENS